MKKFIVVVLLSALILGCIAGCTKKQNDAEDGSASADSVTGIVMDSEIVTEASDSDTAVSGTSVGKADSADSSLSTGVAADETGTALDSGITENSADSSGSADSTAQTVAEGDSTDTESTAVKEGPGGIELPYDYFD